MTFLLIFSEIQDIHFNILPKHLPVSEAHQKTKRSYCKPIQSVKRLEWTQGKEQVLWCQRAQLVHRGSQACL